MTICILVTDIYLAGGCERVAANLANSFCEKHKVYLVNGFNRGEKEIYRLNSKVTLLHLVNGSVRLRKCYFKTCRKLNKMLHTIAPDITVLINSSTFIFLPAFWNIKTMCVGCEHTNLKNKFHTTSLLSKMERRYAVLRCDKIVTLTDADKFAYIKKYNMLPQKIRRIYNWIEAEAFKFYKVHDGKSKKIISVGRFHPVKGYEMLVKIAEQVLKNNEGWEWHIYGGGNSEYREKIQKMILNRDLGEKLILHNPVSLIYEKYAESDFLVMTSYFEGLPNALLEAKACGLPLVSFSCPTGPDEIIMDGVDGYLISCYDVKMMTKKIESLINEPERIKKFSQNSHHNLEKFSKGKILNEWEILFDDLIKEKNY